MIGARHPSLGRLRRLSRQRGARSSEAAYVIDGPTLLSEALDAGVRVDEVIAEPGAPASVLDRAARAGAEVHAAAVGALAKATDTVTPQAVAAIARLPESSLDEALEGLAQPELVLVLVGVNDPGNAGTLVRSGEAAGVGAVLFCDESVDPYNPKCVRAAAGSLFRLRVVRDSASADALAATGRRGLDRIGTVARGGTPYDEVDLRRPTAVVVGSEAHGLPTSVLASLDRRVTIPMLAPVDSLNVGMAGTLVCFEAARQRRAHGGNPLDGAPSSTAGFSGR